MDLPLPKITSNSQIFVFNAWSLAVQETVVTPGSNESPDAWVHENPGFSSKLSETVGPLVQVAIVEGPMISAGHVIIGSCWSSESIQEHYVRTLYTLIVFSF